MTTGELREHSFDGIQEFDNRLPNWWLWTFYLACIFAIVYWAWFHTLGLGDTPRQAYEVEQRAAAARLEAALANVTVDERLLLELSREPAVVAAGEELFKHPERCAQCHGPLANGIVAGKDGAGPNLTDEFWINGGAPMDIYRTILEGGRPDMGMQSWKDRGPTFVQRAAAYVLSLRGTNVPGKAPEKDAVRYVGQ